MKEWTDHLGTTEDSSTAKWLIWGNMELKTSNVETTLCENGHQEA